MDLDVYETVSFFFGNCIFLNIHLYLFNGEISSVEQAYIRWYLKKSSVLWVSVLFGHLFVQLYFFNLIYDEQIVF